MKALVVASSKKVVKTMSHPFHLRWPQATLLSVADGSKAIEVVEAESPDIVILDLDLPGRDGFDVLEQIRLSSHVPLIALASSDNEMDKVRALESGADACMTKSVTVADFSARVKALLRRAMWLHSLRPVSPSHLPWTCSGVGR